VIFGVCHDANICQVVVCKLQASNEVKQTVDV
jgi:hypothetical protein